MKATDHLILPPDVIIAAPEAWTAELRERLGADEGDYVITRPHSRARSIVIDANTAAFLEQFRSPITVVEAVMRHAVATGETPEELLEVAAPLLVGLRQQRLLAVEGEVDAAPIQATFARGARADDLEIIDCVHLFQDVEVYRARRGSDHVALKILRPGASGDARDMLEREAAVLAHLGGRSAAALIACGRFESRQYIVQSWCEGVPVTRAAAALASGGSRSFAPELLTLCAELICVYARLHTYGVVHGDIHPGNVRVASDGTVTLLDFGLSRSDAASHLPPPRRGGIADYFEPEYCRALLHETEVPAATFHSDQYALAAMLYLLLTGAARQDFSLDRRTCLRQVRDGKPLPFEVRGCPPWPAMEALLGRALDTDPSRRFPTMTDLVTAFESAIGAPPLRKPASHPGADFVANVLQRFAPADWPADDGAIDRIRAPRCSINFGAAGIAWFLYRVASLRGDSRLLAAADVWCARARSRAKDEGAFASVEINITADTVGVVSPFHYESGLYLMQALIGRAMGDLSRANQSARAFAHASSSTGTNPDLTLGWSSVLLGCATLAEALPRHAAVDRQPIVELGERLARDVERWIAERSFGDPDMLWLGLAHGWAGLLFALLRWTQAMGGDFPEVARGRLDALAGVGMRDGLEISWPLKSGDDADDRVAFTGWCHGSAGYVLLWTLAHQLLGDDRYLELGRGAARHVIASLHGNRYVNASLCCGYAGQAYALLALHRRTGETALLDAAGEICQRAVDVADRTERPDSLFKGDVGVALLAEDLTRPALACMPLIETEGWARSDA